MKRSIEPQNNQNKLKQSYTEDNLLSLFNKNIWDNNFKQNLTTEIANAKPFEWGLINDLVDDQLLRDIRYEVENCINFTEKETDIYKVNQSGDLANLSNLSKDELNNLPNLYRLRQMLYSDKFRKFMGDITGAGELSGTKLDLSVNTYTKGCHLLQHDDVIGTRQISFIIYLPDPDKVWKEHYGGALRLFPTESFNVPHPDYYAKLVPQFNQFAFFKVKPGYSWHDVEEVKVDKHRLSIQGWYHIPQMGDNGYIEGKEEEWLKANEILSNIDSPDLQKFEYPNLDEIQSDLSNIISNDLELNQTDLENLKEFINEKYLQQDQIESLMDKFNNNSFISIDNLLNDDKSKLFKDLINDMEHNKKMPIKTTEIEKPWHMAKPPHKWSFLYLNARDNINDQLDLEFLKLIQFFKSDSFIKYIIKLTNLTLLTQSIMVRRFRPGLDYTLAYPPKFNKTLNDVMDCLLEGTLSLTLRNNDNEISNDKGGYQVYMLNQAELREDQVSSNTDSILINQNPVWNSFNLVLRDSDVLEFIKFLSFNARGSRWDIKMSWDIKDEGDEEDEDEEEKEEEK